MKPSRIKSENALARASKVMVGGVNSPVRAYNSVGGSPIFLQKGLGAYVWDLDGNKMLDYVNSYGPHILGHSPKAIVRAVQEQAELGMCFGSSTEEEIALAQKLVDAFPGVDKVRFVNSGTEALMSAVRLARAYTGRDKIIKFRGCYHGHTDALLTSAGSGMMTLGIPGSAGVTASSVEHTLTADFNDLDSVEAFFKEFNGNIGAILVEPVAGNMGVVLPEPTFLPGLRTIAHHYGALLIFDEVMTGFRHGYGGVDKVFDVVPDITCLGKIIGGGMPVGAYGARNEIMDMVAPLGPVYQAGTLSGNPMAMQAGIAMLDALEKEEETYTQLLSYTAQLEVEMYNIGERTGVPLQVARYGSMITPFFTSHPVRDYGSAMTCSTSQYAQVFWSMADGGIHLPPSQFEAWFTSTPMGKDELTSTLNAFEDALKRI